MGISWEPAINSAAAVAGVPPQLVAAIIYQESRGNPAAARYEHKFFLKYIDWRGRKDLPGYVPTGCTLDTEKRFRATSFGLMQVMGETARERGFRGEFLPELFEPGTNLRVGCEFLRHLLDTSSNQAHALQRWNGGGNPDYAKQVLDHIHTGRYVRVLRGE